VHDLHRPNRNSKPRMEAITALIQVGSFLCVGGDTIKKQNETCQLTPIFHKCSLLQIAIASLGELQPSGRVDGIGAMGIRPRQSVLQPAAVYGNCGEGSAICERTAVQGLNGTARPTSLGDDKTTTALLGVAND
jgi:hypothetical protein